MAEQPSHLCTSLLPYQLQGLHWLIDKENPKLPTSNNDVIQFWKVHPSRPAGWYLNAVTFFSLDKPPELASGGILADDMGLGKTLQMISLIVADLEKNGKQAGMGGTLIVAPVSVMSNWSQQMECHVQRKHALKVGTFHGNSRAKSAQELSKYDIVITSYGKLSGDGSDGTSRTLLTNIDRYSLQRV